MEFLPRFTDELRQSGVQFTESYDKTCRKQRQILSCGNFFGRLPSGFFEKTSANSQRFLNLECSFASHGVTLGALTVHLENPVIKLYQDCGFEFVALRHHYHLIMARIG